MPDVQLLAGLHSAVPLVGPSLLACDFAHLAREIRRVEDGGARILHLDVMDGVFVPNISIGLPIIEAVRRVTELPLDVHLMISRPKNYLKRFRDAGADLITVHVEAEDDPLPMLKEIRSLGAVPGISLNPPTPSSAIEEYLPSCELVLVMSVMPGFGGQEFDTRALEKIRQIRQMAGPDVLISVDGGVNLETAGSCSEAGADLFVSGSSLFSQDNYGKYIAALTNLVRSKRDVRV